MVQSLMVLCAVLVAISCETIEIFDCGRVTPSADALVIGGRRAKHGQLPWHVGVYQKTSSPYRQICGGTIVSKKVVISAAHCFWNTVEKLTPASWYAVAAGKIYKPWNEPLDYEAQHSDVSELLVPELFRGTDRNFAEDIALLVLDRPFEFKPYIRPVCLDFDISLEEEQLKAGVAGKVAGWGLTTASGQLSSLLNVVDLPVIGTRECLDKSPQDYWEYITSDKICAGFDNGTIQQLTERVLGEKICAGFDSGKRVANMRATQQLLQQLLRRSSYWDYTISDKITMQFLSDNTAATLGETTTLCRGDSGGGLVFPRTTEFGYKKYYLRGVVSTSPSSPTACNAFAITSFTKISAHRRFIELRYREDETGMAVEVDSWADCGLAQVAGDNPTPMPAPPGAVPWHVGLYDTSDRPPRLQLCGGSLVNSLTVITAAHCFKKGNSSAKLSDYFVIAGKTDTIISDIRSISNISREPELIGAGVQIGSITEVFLHYAYKGFNSTYGNDIAVVILKSPLIFSKSVQPICIDFDYNWPTGRGVIASSLFSKDSSKGLQVMSVSPKRLSQCQKELPDQHRRYLTRDKICAAGDAAICQEDSGSGLAFPQSINGVKRYFLMGVASGHTAFFKSGGLACSSSGLTIFTDIEYDSRFLKTYINATDSKLLPRKTNPTSDAASDGSNSTIAYPSRRSTTVKPLQVKTTSVAPIGIEVTSIRGTSNTSIYPHLSNLEKQKLSKYPEDKQQQLAYFLSDKNPARKRKPAKI